MKRLANLLRRAANHIDPPKVDRGLFIRITADTSQAQDAMEALAASVRRTQAAVERSRAAVEKCKHAQEEKTLTTLQGVE